MVSALVLFTAVVVALSAGPDPVIGAITSSLQNILKNTHGSKEYEYPTDITRDIYPVSEQLIFILQRSVMVNVIFRFPCTLISKAIPAHVVRIGSLGPC
jgi:hypothetical protein